MAYLQSKMILGVKYRRDNCDIWSDKDWLMKKLFSKLRIVIDCMSNAAR